MLEWISICHCWGISTVDSHYLVPVGSQNSRVWVVLPLSHALARGHDSRLAGSQTHISWRLQLSNSMLSDNKVTYISQISSQQATLDFNDYATKLSYHMLCEATQDRFCVEISQITSRLDRKQKCLHSYAARFHQSCMSFSVTNSWIAFQITQISTFLTR